MIVEKYLEEKAKNQTPESESSCNVFFRKFVTLIPDDKELNEITREDFIRIISEYNPGNARSFRTIKSNIRSFIEWSIDLEKMTEQQLTDFIKISYNDISVSDKFSLYYFKNFDELYVKLEEGINRCADFSEITEEYDTLRTIVYLLWYGFTVSEIISVKKSDIDSNKGIIYRGVERTPVEIKNERAMSVIIRYAEAHTMRAYKFGRSTPTVLTYSESDYLIRTYKNSHLEESQIPSYFKKINLFHEVTGKKFTPQKLYHSGIFCRANAYEAENGSLIKNKRDDLAEVFRNVQILNMSNADLKYWKNANYTTYLQYKEEFY